ncbi:NADPH:quinone oxidoreductase 2 [Candidatus Burkholderia brachyanthoides]|nr:NADPH:quinone oxidoreductase 2 [Candidatus Burkholderia brachyanthoides]
MSNTIFVTGASGQLGCLVISHLLAHGVAANRIVAGTRDPAKLADLAARGIEVHAADFDDPASLAQSFKGIGTVLIISTDALDGADTRLKQHRNAVSSALPIRRCPNPECSLLSFALDHAGTEHAIKASGLPYLIFRNSWYQENLLRALPNALEAWAACRHAGRENVVCRAGGYRGGHRGGARYARLRQPDLHDNRRRSIILRRDHATGTARHGQAARGRAGERRADRGGPKRPVQGQFKNSI